MASNQRGVSAIVVGAGAGGIAVATRLAKAGIQVTVVEKNPVIGGRCSSIYNQDGYRFEQGTSILIMPDLLRSTFRDLGTTMEAEGLRLVRCDPAYQMWFADGSVFTASSDLHRVMQQVAEFEGPDGPSRYFAWLQESQRQYDMACGLVFGREFTSIFHLLSWRVLRSACNVRVGATVWSRVTHYFQSSQMRAVFSFFAWYFGSSPFRTPSLHNMMAFSEVKDGMWYIVGGLQTLLDALANMGRQLGAEYIMSHPVAEILISDAKDKVVGVRLECGEQLFADMVIVNADMVYTYANLLPLSGQSRSYGRSITHRKRGVSFISFHWAMSRKIVPLASHNIFIPDGYQCLTDDTFLQLTLPPETIFYVHVPSRDDLSAAPSDCECLTVRVMTSHLRRSIDSKALENETVDDDDWDELVARARDYAVSVLQKRTGIPQLSELIIDEIVTTPRTWAEFLNTNRGSAFGLSHDWSNVLLSRPPSRSPFLRGLYFVGADVQPGIGLPLVFSGAKRVAEDAMYDFNVALPWVNDSRRDRARTRVSVKGFFTLLSALLVFVLAILPSLHLKSIAT